MECDTVALVVSYWPGRSSEKLQSFVASALQHAPGHAYEAILVINGPETSLPGEVNAFFHKIVYRENEGYNLGAWNHGWRHISSAKYLLFVQDDCQVISDNWVSSFLNRFQSVYRCGLVAEHINKKWDKPWNELDNQEARAPALLFNGAPVSKAAYYRKLLAHWGVPEGETARHATTVVQFTSRATLEEIGGYREENNYYDAVGAEIAFSKNIESLGYQLVQLTDARHSHIAHHEWEKHNFYKRLKRSITKRFNISKASISY